MFRKTILFSLVCLLVLALVPAPADAVSGPICKAGVTDAPKDSFVYCDANNNCKSWIIVKCWAWIEEDGVYTRSSKQLVMSKEIFTPTNISVWGTPEGNAFQLACVGNGELGEGFCGDGSHQPAVWTHSTLSDVIQCCNTHHADSPDCHLPGTECLTPCGEWY